MSKSHPGRVVTGEDTRWGYVNVWYPRETSDGSNRRLYSVQLIIPKSDNCIGEIRKAIQEAWETGPETMGHPMSEMIKSPLIDGDIYKPGRSEYEGNYYINACSADVPDIVDENYNPIIMHREIYSGCYGRVCIQFYSYKATGKYNFGKLGVACGLRSLQKIADGEHLGRIARAGMDFIDIDQRQSDFARDMGYMSALQ